MKQTAQSGLQVHKITNCQTQEITLSVAMYYQIKTQVLDVDQSYWSGVTRGPQVIQVNATALGFPLELDGTILLLKIPHTLIKGYKEIKMIVNRKLLPCWLAFIVLEGSMQAAERKKSYQQTYLSMNLLTYNIPKCQDRLMDIIEAQMLYGLQEDPK